MKKRVISCIVVMCLAITMFCQTMVVEGGETESSLQAQYYKNLLETFALFSFNDFEDVVYLEDCSDSMEKTFSYEKEIIRKHLSQVEFANEKVFFKDSYIWENMNQFINFPKKVKQKMVIVTDLWDTTETSLNQMLGMQIIIFVPYWSNDEAVVKHVRNFLENKTSSFVESDVAVIYLDGEIDLECSHCLNSSENELEEWKKKSESLP